MAATAVADWAVAQMLNRAGSRCMVSTTPRPTKTAAARTGRVEAMVVPLGSSVMQSLPAGSVIGGVVCGR